MYKFTINIVQKSPFILEKDSNEKCNFVIEILMKADIINILFKEFPNKDLIKSSEDIIHLLILSGDFKIDSTKSLLDCYQSNF